MPGENKKTRSIKINIAKSPKSDKGEKSSKKSKGEVNINIGKGGKQFRGGANAGGFYFLGFLGAATYFISHASDFGSGVLGFLKAIVWPAIVVFEALSKLGA